RAIVGSRCERGGGVGITSRSIVESPPAERHKEVSSAPVRHTGSAGGIWAQGHTIGAPGARHMITKNCIMDDVLPVVIEMSLKDQLLSGCCVGYRGAIFENRKAPFPGEH